MVTDKNVGSDSIVHWDEEGDEEYDFGEFLISDVLRTTKQIACIFGAALPTLKIGDISIRIDEQNVYDNARDRLGKIITTVQDIMKNDSSLDSEWVVKKLLELDGWSITRETLRTPIWLHDIQEWYLDDVVLWHKELACLALSKSL